MQNERKNTAWMFTNVPQVRMSGALKLYHLPLSGGFFNLQDALATMLAAESLNETPERLVVDTPDGADVDVVEVQCMGITGLLGPTHQPSASTLVCALSRFLGQLRFGERLALVPLLYPMLTLVQSMDRGLRMVAVNSGVLPSHQSKGGFVWLILVLIDAVGITGETVPCTHGCPAPIAPDGPQHFQCVPPGALRRSKSSSAGALTSGYRLWPFGWSCCSSSTPCLRCAAGLRGAMW